MGFQPQNLQITVCGFEVHANMIDRWISLAKELGLFFLLSWFLPLIVL